MKNMFEMQATVKLDCFGVLVATQQLLGTLLSLDAVGKDAGLALVKGESEQVFATFHPCLHCRMFVLPWKSGN